jgi:hypothetical protein
MALKQPEIQKIIKEVGLATVLEGANKVDYVQYNNYEIAIPVEVEGKEYWAKISIGCGQLKDVHRRGDEYPLSYAFDPYVAQAEWELEREYKEKLRIEEEKAKAEALKKFKK